jgi:purine-binding chemotaxis protein CheW
VTAATKRSEESAAPQQVLTFRLGEAHYGVDILRVREIRGFSAVTGLPQIPQHILGVLNLRGSIIPIVDLRMRFGLPEVQYNGLTVIIVLAVETADGRAEAGIVVDQVSDVIDVPGGDIRPAPGVGSREAAEMIRGLAPVGDRMIVLLDIDRLIGNELSTAIGAAEAA